MNYDGRVDRSCIYIVSLGLDGVAAVSVKPAIPCIDERQGCWEAVKCNQAWWSIMAEHIWLSVETHTLMMPMIDRMPLTVRFYPILQSNQVACRDVRLDISNSQAEQRRSLLMMRTKPSKPMPPS